MLLEYSVEKPLNREPPLKDLVQTFTTKTTTAYDRNHGPLPHINGDTHVVRIDGLVKNTVNLSMSQLRNDFTQHEVIAALQCAGNRRHTMRTELKEVDGIDWNDGAVCNCTWSGPLLCDVLSRIGLIIEGDAHVAFSCHMTDCQEDRYYGSSISLARCMDPEMKVILALNMNGAPLTINHGFPLRIVIPGIAGARWTKWLDRITIQEEESSNFYMQKDYKILPPEIDTHKKAGDYWHKVKPLQKMPINSAICYPATGDTISLDKLANGELEIAGYALPQGDEGPVIKVEISTDQGKTWDESKILHPSLEELRKPGATEKYKWAWSIWQHKLPAEKTKKIDKSTKIWSRATDKAGNVQKVEDIKWNFRGVGYNGFGEIKNLTIIDTDELSRKAGSMKLGNGYEK
ncbi:molybdopterin binding oxidoreductase [Choiromyces venosus 120613-1]|uniref:Molybdopterin binding oxidoreductase n=1 Tax=Choiromyces venosus 120613-1 TaxID=1336337 RepID=A0A3N4JYZ7_9PEZI|nr:molybdopterin binding oxidoreductase [Choiromyces venosus 120613-1]